MRNSPTPVIALLIVGACLMGVFFGTPDRPAAAKSKNTGPCTVKTRFAIHRPVLPPDQEEAWMEWQMAILTSREFLHHIVYRLSVDQYWKLSAEDAAERLKREFTFKRQPGTNIISITARGDKLDDYLFITDSVRDAYEEYRNSEALEAAARLKQEPPVETSITVLEIAKEVPAGSR